MSARQKRWEIRPPAPPEFIRQLGGSALVASLLYQRGHRDPAAAAAFLTPDYRGGLHDPLRMRGMAEAAARIAAAIDRGEPIAVYGDFDTDGVTAVTLLTQAITAMGGQIRPYIPHRSREGYGLNHLAVGALAADGIRLLITVDCGIANREEVAEAQRQGLDVIVTDHHQPPAELPAALAVVNPKQPDCGYPFKGLVGVGIAYKLIQALARYGKRPGELRGRDLLDLVALGTVADMGPLHDENRVLVKAGLEALNATRRPGLLALIAAAGMVPGTLDSSSIAFGLAPRLNAAGRLDDARRAYELLLTADEAEAKAIAHELNETNRARQELTRRVQAAADALATSSGRSAERIVILADPAFSAGVVGLVAARLAEEYGRPALVIERGLETSRGSARSIPGFSIIDALDRCGDLFVRHGGHAAAAGFTIRSERLAELDARLGAIGAAELTDDMLAPRLMIDAAVSLDAIGWDLQAELARLEPFGQANPQPLLLTPAVTAVDPRPTTGGAHLRMQIRAGDATFDAIGFRLGGFADALRRHPRIDLAYTLEVNEWNGQRRLQLNVKDLRRAAGP